MSNPSAEADKRVIERSQAVESFLKIKLPPDLWMQLLSLTQDYLDHRGLLTLSRWRSAAELLEVSSSRLRTAFADTD